MSPADTEDGLRPDTVADYLELLSTLDAAIYRGRVDVAGERHAELLAFVRSLPPSERGALDQHSALPGWPSKRRRKLKTRWEALQLHRGSWQGWRDYFEQAQRGIGHQVAPAQQASSASSGKVQKVPSQWEENLRRREALREAAKDLVYLRLPGEHRAALWRFCAAGTTPKADAAARGAGGSLPSRASPPLDEKDRAQFEQMMLDVKRTPCLRDGQEDMLVAVLVAYCSRRASAGGALFDAYVQGMHMLAACPLWAGLDQSDALTVFEFVLERLCGGYYQDSSFMSFKNDVAVAEALIEEKLPHLAVALRCAGVPTMSIAFDPLLCLFTYHLPSPVSMRFWDVLLLEGDAAVFALLLVLLEELLPEAVSAPAPHDESIVQWDGFPFADRLHERSESLSEERAEVMLGRVRVMLDGADCEEGGGLRRRLHELRRYGVSDGDGVGQDGCVGAWWSQFRGWFPEDGASSREKPNTCLQM